MRFPESQMSHLNNDQEIEALNTSEDSRAVYLKPELVDMGPVADLTKSSSGTAGTDGSYS